MTPAEPDPRPSATDANTAEMNDRDLAMQFESLGGAGHGGEFGLFQRHCGAEPLGLLRWVDVSADLLIGALMSRFDGVGEAANTILFKPETSDEWWTRDIRYWMAMRTCIRVADVSEELMSIRVRRRVSFLRRKLIEDLEQATKIFVFKDMYGNLTGERIRLLHAAVRSYGPATLFCLCYADEAHPAGTVESPAPGLILGYLAHFTYSRENGFVRDIGDVLLVLCRRAWDVHTGVTPVRTPAQLPAQSPLSADEHASLGMALWQRGEAADAIASIRTALAIEPDNTQFRANYATMVREWGKGAATETELRHAVRCNPGEPHYRVLLAHVLRAGDQLAEAADVLLDAVALDPWSQSLLQELRLVQEARQDWPAAIDALERISAVTGDDPEVATRLAELRYHIGRLHEAAEAARLAAARAPDSARAHRILSEVLMKLGEHTEGLAEAYTAVLLDPTSADGYARLSQALSDSGDPILAATPLRRAIALAPSRVHFQHQMSMLQKHLDRPEDAIEAA